MSTIRSSVLATGLLTFPLLAACSVGGENEAGVFGGQMHVVSCSLGCTSGQGGQQVFCSVINVFQNQEIAVFFAEPVDLFSVNTSSFRVVNVANGTSPTGQFLLDPTNARRLIWRPSLTFDQLGNPQFGLLPNTSYQVTIPGASALKSGTSPT